MKLSLEEIKGLSSLYKDIISHALNENKHKEYLRIKIEAIDTFVDFLYDKRIEEIIEMEDDEY